MNPTFPPAEPLINVLALDIDGVLNRCGASGHGLESDKVALLKSITDQTGCGILLTSTWRKTEHQLARIKRMCQDIGAVFLGCTPISDTQATSGLFAAEPRWKEIKAWRDDHPEVLRFVILDDEREMGSLSGYHIRTDSHTGLTPSIAEQVITVLQCPRFRPAVIVLADRKETGTRFMERPDRWLDRPTWRCPNGHISTHYLKSEMLGADVCLACYEPIWLTFPEDEEYVETQDDMASNIDPHCGSCGSKLLHGQTDGDYCGSCWDIFESHVDP